MAVNIEKLSIFCFVSYISSSINFQAFNSPRPKFTVNIRNTSLEIQHTLLPYFFRQPVFSGCRCKRLEMKTRKILLKLSMSVKSKWSPSSVTLCHTRGKGVEIRWRMSTPNNTHPYNVFTRMTYFILQTHEKCFLLPFNTWSKKQWLKQNLN